MDQYPVSPEGQEAYDRTTCVRNLFVDGCQVSMLPLALGQSIEERYLPDEIVPEENFLATHLASMETAADEISSYLRVSGELTDDDSNQGSDEAYNESRRLFGFQIMDFARRAGLMESMSPTDMASRISLHSPQDPTQLGSQLVESAKNGYADFDTKGWSIFETEETGPMLIMLADTAQGSSDHFDVVHLDQVFTADSAFLQGLIRAHHEVEAKRSVVERATYYPRLHEVVPSEIVPSFMLELSRINDPEQRAPEVQSVLSYLDLMWAVMREGSLAFKVGPTDHDRQRLGRFQDKLKYAGVKFDDERQVYLEHYLSHRAQCPGESEDSRRQAAELSAFYEHIQNLDTYAPMLSPEQKRYIPVLETPHKAMTAAEAILRIEERIPYDDARQRVLPGFRRILPVAEAFKSETGLTEIDIRRLAQISEENPPRPLFASLGLPSIRHYVYAPLFNALALHRRGKIDMKTPVFKSFLKAFIGDDNLDLDALV